MKRSTVVVALLTVLVLALTATVMAATAHKVMTKDVIRPAESLKWEDGRPGAHIAKLWGDQTKGGPYGVLTKFDAGHMNPLHKHTQSLKIVVLSGTLIYQPEGGEETKLGPGSYVQQAGGKNHISGCAAGAECEFFMTSGDKFDMIPVASTEKK